MSNFFHKLNNIIPYNRVHYILICLAIVSCNKGTSNQDKFNETLRKNTDSIKGKSLKNIPTGLQKLLLVYSKYIDSIDENNLYWNDGTKMQYDDGIKEKDFETLLNEPSLKDQMSQPYTKGKIWDNSPAKNFEPGRIRYEPFFKKMYGSNSNEVKQKLVSLKWVDGTIIEFSSINGASDSLKKVVSDLNQLGSEYRKYLINIGGTFNWRNIVGTNRLSNHSFGTAIDINTKYSDYWQWSENMSYKNRIPIEIVEVFELHGFIWGGKWYHYDTMHFEYRPELTIE